MAPYTHSAVYAWRHIRVALYTHDTIYARCHIRMEPYTHGAIYAWSCICMELYMHGAISTWSHICMEPYTHGAVYTWSRICMEPYTCGASSLPLLPACSPCPLSIPGSLELSWGLRKPPAHSPCFQLTTLAPSLLNLLPEHPWTPGTSLRPQETSSSLPLLPEYPLVPGTSLTPSWLQLPPARSQLAPNGQ